MKSYYHQRLVGIAKEANTTPRALVKKWMEGGGNYATLVRHLAKNHGLYYSYSGAYRVLRQVYCDAQKIAPPFARRAGISTRKEFDLVLENAPAVKAALRFKALPSQIKKSSKAYGGTEVENGEIFLFQRPRLFEKYDQRAKDAGFDGLEDAIKQMLFGPEPWAKADAARVLGVTPKTIFDWLRTIKGAQK